MSIRSNTSTFITSSMKHPETELDTFEQTDEIRDEIVNGGESQK